MKTNTFNTRRPYSAKGQRIAVRLLSYDPETITGVIALVDADRHIQETFRVCALDASECLEPRAVMSAYDAHTRCPSGLNWEEEKTMFHELTEAAHAIA